MPLHNSTGNLFGKIPFGFVQKPSLCLKSFGRGVASRRHMLYPVQFRNLESAQESSLRCQPKYWGPRNGAFGKPCPCPRDTRHFRHFRRFTGFEQQSPCFQIRHFRQFRQNPLFLAGQKHGLPKAPFSGPRKYWMKSNGERQKTNKHKEFWRGTPWCVCPVCPVDMSHLSRHMSRLSRGHSAP